MEEIRLSASKLKTLQNCTALYKFIYIDKLPQKSNLAAQRGTLCHLIFQVLGNPRHKKHFDAIVQSNTVKASKAVRRLIKKTAKKFGITSPEDAQLIDEMILVGLKHDFYFAGATKVESEQEFRLKVTEKLVLNGFIDKIAIYNDRAVIRDFKSSAKKFSEEEQDGNAQVLMYSLAHYKKTGEIPDVSFLFLRYPDNPEQPIPRVKESELKGFEAYLSYISEYLNTFTDKQTYSDCAADDPKRRWLCGRGAYKDEPKKDGSGPKFYCAFKYPFDYYALIDKSGKVIKTAHKEEELEQKENCKIEKRRFNGCEKFNTVIKKREDVWDW